MKRLQVQLTEAQERSLRRRASADGHSIARVVREAVDRYVVDDDREARIQRALAVMGRHRSTDHAKDVSQAHDRYLADIYHAKARRK